MVRTKTDKEELYTRFEEIERHINEIETCIEGGEASDLSKQTIDITTACLDDMSANIKTVYNQLDTIK